MTGPTLVCVAFVLAVGCGPAEAPRAASQTAASPDAPCARMIGASRCATTPVDVRGVREIEVAALDDGVAVALATFGRGCAGARVALFDRDLRHRATTRCFEAPTDAPEVDLIASGPAYWLAVVGVEVDGASKARVFRLDADGHAAVATTVTASMARLVSAQGTPLLLWSDARVWSAALADGAAPRRAHVLEGFDPRAPVDGVQAGDRFRITGRGVARVGGEMAIAMDLDERGAPLGPASELTPAGDVPQTTSTSVPPARARDGGTLVSVTGTGGGAVMAWIVRGERPALGLARFARELPRR